MTEIARCKLCGEPMPPGEERFKYHGFSGNCPRPPQQKTHVMAEYIFRDMRNGELWIDVLIDRSPYVSFGPFVTESERQRVNDDLLSMTRSLGAKDLPNQSQ